MKVEPLYVQWMMVDVEDGMSCQRREKVTAHNLYVGE